VHPPETRIRANRAREGARTLIRKSIERIRRIDESIELALLGWAPPKGGVSRVVSGVPLRRQQCLVPVELYPWLALLDELGDFRAQRGGDDDPQSADGDIGVPTCHSVTDGHQSCTVPSASRLYGRYA
jgi:hypothetical protein